MCKARPVQLRERQLQSRAAALLSLLLWVMAAPVLAQAAPGFDVFEFAIEGNSRLTDLEIERAVTPYLGEKRNATDVEAARAALEKAYQDAGYLTVVVTVPEQEVTGGSVTLKVLEGEVERLRVRGAEFHTASGLKDRVPELAEGKVPYFPQVQRELEALNRSAYVKATPVLRPGRAPGTVGVQLDVEDQLPAAANVEFSNRQSPNTTPQRLGFNARYDNLFQRNHSIALTLQTSPQNVHEVRVGALTYVLPVGSRGDALAMYGVVSRSTLATLSGAPGLGLLGNTTIFGLRYAMPLRGAGSYSHSLSLGIDYKDVKQTVTIAGGQLPAPISYAPLVAAYNGGWLGENRSTLVDLTLVNGLRGVFGNRDSEFDAKRLGASADFVTLRAGVRHTEKLARWTLSGRFEMQVASGPLVTNEQYAAGGAENVRGYLESERVADAAVRYSVEARAPSFGLSGGDGGARFTLLAFADGVSLRTLEPVFPTPAFRALRGAGFGLRVSGVRGLTFDLDLARASRDGDTTRSGDSRIHARLLWEI